MDKNQIIEKYLETIKVYNKNYVDHAVIALMETVIGSYGTEE